MLQFSIIVPTYNSSQYISKCINSIQSQTVSDFECIIINDGSNDNTIDICNAQTLNDTRFHIITTSNKGTSNARNVGLEQARGKYIVFVDSDDWIEPTLLEDILKNSKDEDIIQYDFYKISCENKYAIHINSTMNLIIQGEGAVVWKRAFKRDIIKDLRFNTTIRGGEDYLFCTQAFLNCKTYKYLCKCLYNYNTNNEQSIMHCGYIENFIDQLKATLEVEKILKTYSIYETYKPDIRRRYFWCIKELCLRWITESSKTPKQKKITIKIITKLLKIHL